MRSYGVFLSLSDPLLSHCMYFSWVISFEPESLIIIYMPMNINFIYPSRIFHFHSRATLLLPTWTFCLSKEPQTCPFKTDLTDFPHIPHLHPTCSPFNVLYVCEKLSSFLHQKLTSLPQQLPLSHIPCYEVFYIAIA